MYNSHMAQNSWICSPEGHMSCKNIVALNVSSVKDIHEACPRRSELTYSQCAPEDTQYSNSQDPSPWFSFCIHWLWFVHVKSHLDKQPISKFWTHVLLPCTALTTGIQRLGIVLVNNERCHDKILKTCGDSGGCVAYLCCILFGELRFGGCTHV